MPPKITKIAHEASAKAQAETKRLNHPMSPPLWPVVRPRGANPVDPVNKPRAGSGPKLTHPSSPNLSDPSSRWVKS